MGCVNVKQGPIDGRKRAVETRRSNTSIEAFKGKNQQGVAELKKVYTIDNRKVIGAGQFGRVFEAYHTADTQTKVAIKVLDKHQMGDMLGMIKDEIEIL